MFIGTSDSSDGASNADITVLSDGTYLNIAGSIPAVVWTVIKGGSNHNTYGGDRTGLRSHLNGGGDIPTISYWGVCYQLEVVVQDTTTTEAPTTTGETEGIVVTAAPTSTAAPSPSDPTNRGRRRRGRRETLLLTGTGSTWPLAALGLVLLSVGLVIVVSQRVRIQA